MMTSQVIELASAMPNCCHCRQKARCFPHALEGEDLRRFAAAVRRKRVVQRAEHVFMQDDSCDTLYLLRSGSLKAYVLDDNGEEQVLAFYLPGDVLGLDALNQGRHHSSAVALETSSVCELSFARLEGLVNGLSVLQQKLNGLFSREIARDYSLLRLLGKKSAEQRLGGFLLQLSQQYAERGYSAYEFNLSMSRHDIGDYLGLALETVSRLFSRLQKQGVLAVNGRRVMVLDHAKLAALAGGGERSVNCRQAC